MIYSLIPAKVSSERLPGKNTFKFMLGNKPLIAYTTDAVIGAEIAPHVFTNEKDIVNTYGIKIITRKDDICTNQTTMKDTVSEFIRIMELENNDTILLTYLTCPFRTSEDIKNALDLFNNCDAKSLQSLTPVDYRPYGLMEIIERYENYDISPDGSRVKDLEDTIKLRCLQDQKDYYQKQNTPTLYKANGAIYIFKVSELGKLNNQMFNDETIGFVLDEVHGLDIDTELDLLLAKAILEKRKNECFLNQLPDSGERKTEYCSDWTGTNCKRFETNWA